MTEVAKASGQTRGQATAWGEDWNADKAEVLKIATGQPGNTALRDKIAEELEAKWDGAREVVGEIFAEAVAEAERKAKAAQPEAKVIVLGAPLKRRRILVPRAEQADGVEKSSPEPSPEVALKGVADAVNAAIGKAGIGGKPEASARAEPEPKAEVEAELAQSANAAKPIRVPFADDAPIVLDGAGAPVLSMAAPYDNAREFARRHCWKDGKLVVYSWADDEGKVGLWEWNGRVYQKMPEPDLKSRVYVFLDKSVVRAGERLERFRPKQRHVTELLDGLSAGLALPSWCDPPMRLDTGQRAGDVMMFRDALIEVRSGAKVPATPNLWVQGSVGYEWNPAAGCERWLEFLASIFPDDQEAQDGVEEFLGLSMTEDVSFQKGIALVGVTRGGKGTLIRIAEGLVASAAFASVDLDVWMKGEFSGQVLIGKKVIAFADVRLKPPKWYGQNFDAGGIEFQSVQRLLKITSGDGITVARKFKAPFEGVLPGKVWMASNKVPNYNDGTLPGRFLKYAFEVSFLGREDKNLSARLLATELPGIAGRCLKAYRRACERGRLIQPRSGERLNREIAKNSDPFTQFMLDNFVSDPKAEPVIVGKIYGLFEGWCARKGQLELMKSVTRQSLKKWIKQVPGFEHVDNAPRPHAEPRSYSGLRLRTRDERAAEDE